MNKTAVFFAMLAVLVICPWGSRANENAGTQLATNVSTTTTVVTKTQTKTVVKTQKKWQPFKVCVLDFTTIDIEGQKRFLDIRNQPIIIPTLSTLTVGDNAAMNSTMQGWVRMIDAEDNARTNEYNRQAQAEDNEFNRQKALQLYKQTVQGTPRPMIIGADYLTAYLGRHSDVFSCMDSSLVVSAMYKLQTELDFPENYLLKLARMTGTTHLIYGTVSDIRSAEKSFKGYGIETKVIVYELDVIVKMVDLVAQGTVYSNVYTGSYQLQLPYSGELWSNDIFQNLMQSALQQAAEDFYNVCKPGRKNKVTVTPLPENNK